MVSSKQGSKILSSTSNIILYRDFNITVTIKPSLKYSYLKIIDTNTLHINTPVNSKKFIQNFIDAKYKWILKHIKTPQDKKLPTIALGKNILLLGELQNITEESFVYLYKKLKSMRNQTQQNIEFLYANYYKMISQEYLLNRVIFFSKQMNLYPKKLIYRKMRRRLGSCNSQKEITFNTLIMKLPPHLIDYVVVHELAHLKHMNHSRAFHLLVQRYLPDEKKSKTTKKSFQIIT